MYAYSNYLIIHIFMYLKAPILFHFFVPFLAINPNEKIPSFSRVKLFLVVILKCHLSQLQQPRMQPRLRLPRLLGGKSIHRERKKDRGGWLAGCKRGS